MRAIQANPGRELNDPDAFELVDMELPVAHGHDLLVHVEAISVNPVDTKMRQALREPAILGWDAVGVVSSVGEAVTLFHEGDRVFYAGSIKRPGCNAGWAFSGYYRICRAKSRTRRPWNPRCQSAQRRDRVHHVGAGAHLPAPRHPR